MKPKTWENQTEGSPANPAMDPQSIYNTNMSAKAFPDWSASNAFMEAAANFFDQAPVTIKPKTETTKDGVRVSLMDGDDMETGYMLIEGDKMTFVNFDAELPDGSKMFVLGESGKRVASKGRTTIGRFGEGLKAMMAIVMRLGGSVVFKGVFSLNGRFQARKFEAFVDEEGVIALDNSPFCLDSNRFELVLRIPGFATDSEDSEFNIQDYIIIDPELAVSAERPGKVLDSKGTRLPCAANNMLMKHPSWSVLRYNLYIEPGNNAIDRARNTIHLKQGAQKSAAYAVSEWLKEDPTRAGPFIRMISVHDTFEHTVIPLLDEDAKAIMRAQVALNNPESAICTDDPDAEYDEENIVPSMYVLPHYLSSLYDGLSLQTDGELYEVLKQMMLSAVETNKAEFPEAVKETLAHFGVVTPVHGGNSLRQLCTESNENIVNVDAIPNYSEMTPEDLLCHLFFKLRLFDVASSDIQLQMIKRLMAGAGCDTEVDPTELVQEAADGDEDCVRDALFMPPSKRARTDEDDPKQYSIEVRASREVSVNVVYV